jgi:two-component system chemotaxis response regulator CheY
VKILIVDDSRAMRSLVKRAVEQAESGHELAEAANGVEALRAIETRRPDLVLSDWNMPEMNGLELLRALRSAGDATPFGFVTSDSSPHMRELAQNEGAQFLISKPFTSDTLRAALAGVRS